MSDEKLMELALQARESSYSPYSHFRVGAALLCADDSVYTGCNIECASYSPTNCAERTAVFKAVSEGEREFSALAVAGGPKGEPPSLFCTPCGVCRQMLAEFCGAGLAVLLVKSQAETEEHTLGELFPLAFGPGMLEI